MSVPATLTADEAARRRWDVLVVGAGPAGSLAAREAARRGLATLLVEREALPRWKVCGCCLNGSALAGLSAVGLGELPSRCGAVPLGRLRLGVSGRSADVALAGVSLSRQAFDAALASEAVAAGAAFLPRTRAALLDADAAGRTVALHGPDDERRTRAAVVLAADGLGGKLLARAGLTEAPPEPAARLGAGVVLADGPGFYAAGTVYMACGSGGYVGLVRLEDGRLDVAAALDAGLVRSCGGPGGAAARILDGVGWPAAGVAGADWRGTAPLTRRARRLGAERVFVLGDAAGYVEPFTGEGMAWALAAARAVAPLAERAVAGWRPELIGEWAAAYRRTITRRQGVCRLAAAVLRRPWLTRAAVALLRLAPALAAPVVRWLNAPVERVTM
jgi:menaquinone-9 beta-reductase